MEQFFKWLSVLLFLTALVLSALLPEGLLAVLLALSILGAYGFLACFAWLHSQRPRDIMDLSTVIDYDKVGEWECGGNHIIYLTPSGSSDEPHAYRVPNGWKVPKAPRIQLFHHEGTVENFWLRAAA